MTNIKTEANTTPCEWHQNNDELVRKQTLIEIFNLLCHTSKRNDKSIYCSLAQKLEVLLYFEASPLTDYSNVETLESRIIDVHAKSRHKYLQLEHL
jgi:hypothetical protein